MAQAIIKITDVLVDDEANPGGKIPSITGEITTSDPADTEAPANKLAAWLGANWEELVLLFRAQLTADQQERTGEQPVATGTGGPKLVGADGKTITSEG